MSRLFVICEGQTEETFVNEVLAPHLYSRGWQGVSARIMGNARQRKNRGGIKGWSSVSEDIIRRLKEDRTCYLTTLVDFYALPSVGPKGWPGRAKAATLPFPEKGPYIERALLEDLRETLGDHSRDALRVIPFVLMHEFEALCFADAEAFARAIGKPDLGQRMHEIREAFGSPEEINDNPETAPSKRLLGLYPEYQKPLAGNIGLLEIGLEAIRTECHHFAGWLRRLEAIVA